MNFKHLIGLTLLWLPLAQAAPELNVGALYDYLDGDKTTLVKRIRNGGDTTAFVKISVAEIVYGDDGQSREVALDDVALEQRGLVVSPARLIVPAAGMQSVRLLYRGQRDQERYYRLRFIPVLPENGDGFALSDSEAKAYGEQFKAGVQLLAGYGTLLFVRPGDTRFDTPVASASGQLQVRNNGNATVVLDHFRQCTPDGRDCETATKHHLRPGTSRAFPQAQGRVYNFELIEGGKRQELAINQ